MAMLVGPDAPLALEAKRSTHAMDVWDFYKPKHSEYAAVDGKLSQAPKTHTSEAPPKKGVSTTLTEKKERKKEKREKRREKKHARRATCARWTRAGARSRPRPAPNSVGF